MNRRTLMTAAAALPALFLTRPATAGPAPFDPGRAERMRTAALLNAELARSPMRVGPGIPRETIEAENAAAERLFAEIERTLAVMEEAEAPCRHMVSPQTSEERRQWQAKEEAERAWWGAREALLRQPFVQAKHHRRKVEYIEANDDLTDNAEDLWSLTQGLLGAMAIIHGDRPAREAQS